MPSLSTLQQRAAITPLPGELFLKTIDINLDDDEDFEQIIVSKKSPSSTSLEIVVADFLSTLGIYSRYFDGAVAATKLDSIIVQTMDMTADGLPDLIVQGLDEFNNQTLTVFQRSQIGAIRVSSPAPASTSPFRNKTTPILSPQPRSLWRVRRRAPVWTSR